MVVIGDEKKADEAAENGYLGIFKELVKEDDIDAVHSGKLLTPPYPSPPLPAATVWRNAEMLAETVKRNPALAQEIINLLEKEGRSSILLPKTTNAEEIHKHKHKDKVHDLFFYLLMAVLWITTTALFLLTVDPSLIVMALALTVFALMLQSST